MIIKRERGQERTTSRTVGKREPGTRPRVSKRDSTPTDQGRRPYSPRPERGEPVSGKRIGKTKVIKTSSGSRPASASTAGRSGFKERTSDVFRRDVIQKRAPKIIERAESDQFLNKEGKVLRGKFGKQNLHNEVTSTPRAPKSKTNKEPGSMRLNRYIANAGLCSRREADTFIATGCVTVNGKIVSEMGHQVLQGDSVSFNGKVISSEKKVYVLLNKPKGYVTTLEDPHADKTVMELIANACPERIYPVGRLDKNTTGLLLFTNDGDLTKRLTHPKYNRKKIYHVFTDQNVTKNHLQEIVDGITLEDGFVAADSVSYVSDDDKKQVGIEIHSGKNKIVRRIFEHLGYKVIKLDRVYFCGLTKKDLPRGRWRMLTPEEVNLLKMSSN
ncbi:MAG: pseudouridine synthase [Mariniphaga sp.]